MRKKNYFLSISLAALLILAIFPNIQSISTTLEYELSQDISSEKNQLLDSGSTTFKIYHIKGDGKIQLTKQTISKDEKNALIEELKITNTENVKLPDQYENKFNILKKYNLVPNDIKIEDIIDFKKFPSDYEVVSGENFNATTAPIFFFGGGLGVGLGIPFFITAGTFLVALLGLGITICYDIHDNILYQLQALLLPVIVGYLNGFVGLLMIPVVPGFIYSNFFAIGVVAKTSWIQILGY